MKTTENSPHPPPTERLIFRTWTEDDTDLAVSLWTHAEVMRFMGGAMTESGAQERLRQEINRQREFGFQYWPIFLREDGRFAGCAGLRLFHEDADVLELGVHIARPCWSLRLGEEAAQAVIAFAFAEHEARVLVAGHGPGNTNSKALIERLGFVYTHESAWGPKRVLHPFYRLERAASSENR